MAPSDAITAEARQQEDDKFKAAVAGVPVTHWHATQKTPHQVRVMALMNRIRAIGGLPSLPKTPTIPAEKNIIAQARLVFEETMELLEACGLTVIASLTSPNGAVTAAVHRQDCSIVADLIEKPIDIAEVAKEAADVSVVTIGMMAEFGISDARILEAVDENNLGKFVEGAGGYLDEHRKWHKPPGYAKPDIIGILKQQGYEEKKDDGSTEAQLAEAVPVPGGGDQQERKAADVPG